MGVEQAGSLGASWGGGGAAANVGEAGNWRAIHIRRGASGTSATKCPPNYVMAALPHGHVIKIVK